MITYTQDYYVIQNTLTKELWNGAKWITPEDRLDIYACSLDPDDLEKEFKTATVKLLNSEATYELRKISIETIIHL